MGTWNNFFLIPTESEDFYISHIFKLYIDRSLQILFQKYLQD